jgi:hypothetical protein
MNFAVIENNIVTNIIVADSKAIAEEVTGFTCIEYADEDMPHIGLGYVDGVFEQPVAVPVEPTE